MPGVPVVRKTSLLPEAQEAYMATYKSTATLLPMIERHLITRYEEYTRATDVLHPSEIAKAKWCPKKLAFDIEDDLPPEDEYVSMTLESIFSEGHGIHDKYQRWLSEVGVLWGQWVCQLCSTVTWGLAADLEDCTSCHQFRWKYGEVPLASSQYPLAGHTDGVVMLGPEDNPESDPALLEVKSIGLGTVRVLNPQLYDQYLTEKWSPTDLWRNINRPFPDHVRQGMLYIMLAKEWARAEGRYVIPKIDRIIFIYEFKPTQQTKEFVVTFNPNLLATTMSMVKQVAAYLDGGPVPSTPYWINTAGGPTSSACGSCRYSQRCWGADNSPSQPQATYVTKKPIEVKGTGIASEYLRQLAT